MSDKVYTIAFYDEITDCDAFDAYAELAAPAVINAGARYLARDFPVMTREAGKNARVTLLEWDSLEDAEALYSDPAYVAAFEKLEGSVRRDIRIVTSVKPGAFMGKADVSSN
ncbi:DUF1330 domain-containing protein [Hoeflea prorocentri]|uniref:DUF1330 domain-containing protein n=1 Tax=Hoeflea prorocentri TaxID=1922333 RepID=A0A9X3ZID0_9HYPH|nr:DUF1330 domain-containing protein [Hoeflea prorocentri]MCY6381883.1 DUF1330 domain-containing protein [Hoeflea prorocentri]MDA5399683.1 DUF1330 domain-containing protein [Hoeflea prorocentri]